MPGSLQSEMTQRREFIMDGNLAYEEKIREEVFEDGKKKMKRRPYLCCPKTPIFCSVQ